METSTFVTSAPSLPLQPTRIELDEPISGILSTDDQQRCYQGSQDVEITRGDDSLDMYFPESQTNDRGNQLCSAPRFIYKNTILDGASSWARRWHRSDIEGGEVFYQPEVSYTQV
jgi:hypothetical protein